MEKEEDGLSLPIIMKCNTCKSINLNDSICKDNTIQRSMNREPAFEKLVL